MTDAREPRRIAAFDFDGTITQRDTLAGFLRLVAGPLGLATHTARRLPQLIAGMRHDDQRDDAKAALLGDLLRGRSDDELCRLGEQYAAALPRRFRPDTVERIDWHRQQGHELVMVSASLVYYLRPVAAALGFDHVIGVEMATEDGRLTGSLARPNVRAAEKAVRITEWWGDRPADELWAYGNSSGDTQLLELAHHPTWVK